MIPKFQLIAVEKNCGIWTNVHVILIAMVMRRRRKRRRRRRMSSGDVNDR